MGSSVSERVAVCLVVLVVVSSVGIVGGAVADGSVDPRSEADATITSGGSYFVGQVLYTGAFDPDDSVTLLYENGTFVTQVPVNADGSVVIETARRQEAEYVLTNDDDTELQFRLVDQEYEVEIDQPVRRNDGPDTTTVVWSTSNRNRFTHVVTAAGLSVDQLDGMFPDGSVQDVDDDGADELAIENTRIVDSFEVDFEGIPPGSYTLNFAVPDTGVARSVDVTVEIYPDGTAEVLHRGDGLRIQQASQRRIEGDSTLPDGTRLTVAVENVGGQTFRRSQSILVQDGAFSATFDFSGIPVGQQFNVTVRQGSFLRDSVRGTVVRRASIRTGAVDSDGSTVTVDDVYLPNGGFVAVADAGGTTVLGTSGFLDPGSHENVTVQLAEPLERSQDVVVRLHRDTDADERFGFERGATVDLPYQAGGTSVTKLVAVTVPTPTQTPTVTASRTETTTETSTVTGTSPGTGTATRTPTGTTTGTDDGTPTGTTAGSGSPGFGLVVAVVALVAAVVVFRRRR